MTQQQHTNHFLNLFLQKIKEQYDMPYLNHEFVVQIDHHYFYYSFWSENTPHMTQDDRQKNAIIHEFIVERNDTIQCIRHHYYPHRWFHDTYGYLFKKNEEKTLSSSMTEEQL